MGRPKYLMDSHSSLCGYSNEGTVVAQQTSTAASTRCTSGTSTSDDFPFTAYLSFIRGIIWCITKRSKVREQKSLSLLCYKLLYSCNTVHLSSNNVFIRFQSKVEHYRRWMTELRRKALRSQSDAPLCFRVVWYFHTFFSWVIAIDEKKEKCFCEDCDHSALPLCFTATMILVKELVKM